MAMTNIQTWKDNLGDQTMTNIQRTFSRQWLILKITQSKVSSFEIGKKLLKISPHGSYHPLPNSGSHAQCSLQANHISFVYVSCLSNCLQWLPSRRSWQQRPSPPPRSQISPPMLPPSRRSPSRSPPPPPPPCFLCLYTTRAGQLTLVTLLSLLSSWPWPSWPCWQSWPWPLWSPHLTWVSWRSRAWTTAHWVRSTAPILVTARECRRHTWIRAKLH